MNRERGSPLKIIKEVVQFSWKFFSRFFWIGIFLEPRAILFILKHWNPRWWNFSAKHFIPINTSKPFMLLYAFSVLWRKLIFIFSLKKSYITDTQTETDFGVQQFSNQVLSFNIKESWEFDDSGNNLLVNSNRLVIIKRWVTIILLALSL
mgnify:CR=1 FL=1